MDDTMWLEAIFTPSVTYEIFTPFGNEAAAQILYEFLQNMKETDKNIAAEDGLAIDSAAPVE